ncbi:hypothetical protein ACS0TY_007352 [Phlomoides rotata]
MALMLTFADSLRERTTVIERLVEYLVDNGTQNVPRKRNRDPVENMAEAECPRKLLDRSEEGLEILKKLKIASEVNLERRTSLDDVEITKEALDEHLVTVTEDVKSLGVAQAEAPSINPRACKTLGEIESREQSLRRAHELLAERERKVDETRSALEDREKGFSCFLEEKKKEIELKEEELRLKLEDEKLRIDEIVERLISAENKLEGMRENLDKRLEEIECKENVAWESAALSVKEGHLITESLEKKLEEFDKRSKFYSFQEEKMRELESKEQLLNERSEKVASLQKQLEEFEKTEVKKMGELHSKEQLLNETRESLQKQLEEFEKTESRFNSFQEKKTGELHSKEQLLNEMSKKVAEYAKLTNENLIRRERTIHQLLKRLKLAKDNVEGLKDVVDQRFKGLVSKENDLNSASDWVEEKMDEADLKAKKLEVKKNSIIKMENEVICKRYELREKEKKLDSWEQYLQACQVELEVKQKEVDSAQELNGRWSEKLDAREKSMRELTGKCFKEHQAKKKEVVLVKDLVEKVARFLGLEDENVKNAIRELEFWEKRMIGQVEEHELIHRPSSDNSNGHVRKELNESADLKFTVRMDGKNLQMFLNDPEKNLVSMSDEIFTVLHLSSDPAKLVLDAMVGFYPPHLREGDTALNVRKTCIALLKQLMKMSAEIKPCVREEAMQVALAWKYKMAENPSSLEVLGFLLLLAAYNIASSFNKDEISTLQMMVSLHREETPDLDKHLGFVETLAEKRSN